MILRYWEMHSPKCDFCGHTLPAERDDATAEEAMRRDGWEKRGGKDACRVCLLTERETGKLPVRRLYPTIRKETKEMEDTNLITQAEQEAEAETAQDPTTLLSDAVHCIRKERERIEERSGARFASAYESYSVLMKALEDKTAAEKDLKDAVKKLWEGTKNEDEDVILAFLSEIKRVARESAMAWIHVAAIAEKAEESV